MKKTKQKKSRLGQYDAKYFLTALNISEPLRFATLHRPVFNDLQKVFLTLYGPRSLDDLLAYGVKGRKATDSNSLRLAQPRPFYLGSANSSICTISKNVAFDIFKKLKREAQSIVLNRVYELSEAKISSDEFWTLLRSKVSRPSGMEDNNKIKNNKALLTDGRQSIIAIASAELGVREATGNNDGLRVEEYLRYTNLGKGYEWCAAFVSWCYGQAGLSTPRNPWSPALFPKARSYKETDRVQSADLFGIYSAKLKRINHVGLVKERQGQYILTVEGNSNDRVESRRRHVNTVYRYADWVN